MAGKLKKRFVYKYGLVEIKIVDWDDGTPLGYVWFGISRKAGESPQYAFDLNAKPAIALAKAILAAAKAAGIKV